MCNPSKPCAQPLPLFRDVPPHTLPRARVWKTSPHPDGSLSSPYRPMSTGIPTASPVNPPPSPVPPPHAPLSPGPWFGPSASSPGQPPHWAAAHPASPPPHSISGSHGSPLPSEEHGWEARRELGTRQRPSPRSPLRGYPPPAVPQGARCPFSTLGLGLRLLHRWPLPGCSLPDPCSLRSASGLMGSPHLTPTSPSPSPHPAPCPLRGNCLPLWLVLLPEGPHLGHQGTPPPAHQRCWRSF